MQRRALSEPGRYRARVDDAAVVTGLVRGDSGFGLEDDERAARATEQRHRRCQPHDASTDHRDVIAGRGHARW